MSAVHAISRFHLALMAWAICQPALAQYPVPDSGAARVGEIHIIGNTVTRDDVIRRQVPLYPGQVLSYPDLRRAEANLRALNIFSVNDQLGVRPTVEVIDPWGPSPFKDILVTVEEAPTRSFGLQVDVNSDLGVSGGVIFNERNFDLTRLPLSWDDLLAGNAFRGGGQEFNIEVLPGNELQRYSISWREPFLLDSLISLSVGGYYRTQQYLEYDDSRLGLRVGLGRRLADYWSINGGLRAENVGVSDVSPFAPIDYQEVIGHTFVTGFRLGVAYDDRDSYFWPTEGRRIDVSAEQAVGDFNYPLLTAGIAQFFSFLARADGSGRHVLALRSRVGWAGDDTPVFDRFFTGGMQTIRGFSYRGVGPDSNGFKVGGNFLFLNSVEYQLPLLPSDRLYLAAFVDSGTVESDVEITTYRIAAGLGARVFLPRLSRAPLAFDFAVPVIKADTDVRQLFSFGVGLSR